MCIFCNAYFFVQYLYAGSVCRDSSVYSCPILRFLLLLTAASNSARMVVEPPEKPFNIHCVTNATIFLKQYTICYWDEAGNSQNTTYNVTMKQ